MHGAKGGGHAKKGAVRCFEVACMAWRRGPAQLECRQPWGWIPVVDWGIRGKSKRIHFTQGFSTFFVIFFGTDFQRTMRKPSMFPRESRALVIVGS